MKGTREIHGIIPLSIKDVFTTISQTQSRRFQIRVSYLEIYNEVIKDLLDPENQNLKIREDFVNGKGVYVSGAKEEEVACMEDMLKLMEKGEHYRHFGNTAMNDQSSRSHTIFRIMIESIDGSIAKQMVEEEDFDIYTTNSEVLFSTLNLVDLAGSERVLYTQAQGDRLREGGHINKSLLTLGNVIAKLSEGNSSHIPYRDSKLTRILSNSLGGNSKTAIICTITPASQHFEETHSTLKFANRAKSINNQVTINQIINEKALLKKLKQENLDWKNKFQERVNGIEDELHRSERERDEIVKSYEEKIALLQKQLEEKNQLDDTISSLRKALLDKEKDLEWIETVSNNEKQLSSQLTLERNTLQQEVKRLSEEHCNNLSKVKEDHIKEIENLTLQHKTSMQELVYQHELEIQEHNRMLTQQLEVDYQEKLDSIVEDLKSEYEREKESLISVHNHALQQVQSSISESEALEFQTTIQSLQDNINELISTKDELELNLDHSRNQNSLLSKEYETLSHMIKSLKEQVEEKDSIISNQQEQIEEYKRTLERVDEELTLLKEQQIDQLEIDHLKDTVQSLTETLEEKDKDIEKLQFDCEMYKSAVSNQNTNNLEEIVNEKNAHISKLEQEVEMKERTFKEEMDEAIARIRELEQEKNAIIVGTTSQLEQINKVTVDNERLTKEIKELRSKIEYGKAKSQQLIEERKRKENPNLVDYQYYPKTPNSDFKKLKMDDENKENKFN